MSVSITQYVSGIVKAIFTPSRLDDRIEEVECEHKTPGGPEGIERAMDELKNLTDEQYEVTLGLPDIVGDGADFFENHKVVIPLKDAPYDGLNRLVFDLAHPEDPLAKLNRLMDALDVEEVSELHGKTVPVDIIGGNQVVLWDEVFDPVPEDGMKESEDNPHETADIEDSTIVTETEMENTDDVDADEAESGDERQSQANNAENVTVEETTVSPSDDAESASESSPASSDGDTE